MILVDNALRALEAENRPIRVGLIGAGFMAQGLSNQIANSVPGMRVAAIYGRRIDRATDILRYSGLERPQGIVDEDHAAPAPACSGSAEETVIFRLSSGSLSSRSAQTRSFSEISDTGNGHARLRRGSS